MKVPLFRIRFRPPAQSPVGGYHRPLTSRTPVDGSQPPPFFGGFFPACFCVPVDQMAVHGSVAAASLRLVSRSATYESWLMAAGDFGRGREIIGRLRRCLFSVPLFQCGADGLQKRVALFRCKAPAVFANDASNCRFADRDPSCESCGCQMVIGPETGESPHVSLPLTPE